MDNVQLLQAPCAAYQCVDEYAKSNKIKNNLQRLSSEEQESLRNNRISDAVANQIKQKNALSSTQNDNNTSGAITPSKNVSRDNNNKSGKGPADVTPANNNPNKG